MSEILFEKITKKYYSWITELYNYYVINSTATYHIKELSEKEVINYFHLEEKNTYSFMIKKQALPVGFCLIKPFIKGKDGFKFTDEVTIYIKPGNINKGIGITALKYLEECAINNNLHVLIASICPDNTGSKKLFEKAGYLQCGFFPEIGYKFDKFLDVVYYQKIIGK